MPIKTVNIGRVTELTIGAKLEKIYLCSLQLSGINCWFVYAIQEH